MTNNKSRRLIYVGGMHCPACETLVGEELLGVAGVDEVQIDQQTGQAKIFFGDVEPNFEDIKSRLAQAGYTASATPIAKGKNGAGSLRQWFYSVLIFAGLVVIYQAVKFFGLLDWLVIDPANISLGVALLVGIVASLSSCLAVVGGVVVSFAAKYKSSGNLYQSAVRPHLLFQLGRLATFFLLGGVLGVIGSWFNFSGVGIGFLTAGVAVVMFLLGLNILGLVPSFGALGIRLPRNAVNSFGRLKQSEHALAPLLLGGFTFFLPCGFTQSMQLYAIAQGSFWAGAFSLFLFALGTAPVLVGLGIATSRFKNFKLVVFQKVAGLVVLIFAFYTLAAGLALAGINIDWGAGRDFGQTVAGDHQQIVVMEVDYSGYSPSVFNIKKDVPVKWVINVKQLTGCTSEITIPSLGISKPLKLGENIIEFTPTQAGNLAFNCWMGMVRGKFVVAD